MPAVLKVRILGERAMVMSKPAPSKPLVLLAASKSYTLIVDLMGLYLFDIFDRLP